MKTETCKQLNNDIKKESRKIRDARRDVTNKSNETKDMINDRANEPMSDVDELKDHIRESRRDIDDKVKTVEDMRDSFAGSCLDGIMNALDDMKNNLAKNLSDSMPDGIPELDMLGSTKEYSELLDKLGISDMINKADEILGCMADAECIPIEEIDDYNEEINDFVDAAGLTIQGDFDLDEFLEGTDIRPEVKHTVEELDGDYENLKTESKARIEDSKKVVSKENEAPEDFF